jgi:hypothetical protein
MGVSGDDHVYALGDGIDAERLEIVENVDGSLSEPDELGIGVTSRPFARIDIASDRRDRRCPPKSCEDIGPADVPGVNDVVDAREMLFPPPAATDRAYRR